MSLPFVKVSFNNKVSFIICFNYTLTLFSIGMATMKENKGKGVVDEVTQSQPLPSAGDKRKRFSKMIDLGNLPSRRGNKKAKHKSSKPRAVKPGSVIPPTS